MKKLSLFFLTLVSLPAYAQKADISQSLLWEISGNGLRQPSYLFGTNHLLTEGYLKTQPVVLQKFNASQGVVTEMVFDSSKIFTMAMQMMMMDSTLDQLLTEAEYKAVHEAFEKTSTLSADAVDKMKPIASESVITEVWAQDMIPEGETGVPMDMYFMAEAQKQGKVLNGLETMEQQMSIFMNSVSLSQQARHLVEVVINKEKSLKELRLLMRLYRTQQLDSLYAQPGLAEYSPEQIAPLLKDRNLNWMNQLPEYIQARATFIAVGALHLPGENGLIAELRKKGYTVKPVSTAN